MIKKWVLGYMDSLPFKSSEDAFEYAQKYFGEDKLSLKSSFIGIVRFVDNVEDPPVYKVDIVCKVGNFFNRQSSKTVAAVKHPDLKVVIKENDLVVFGPDNISIKIPTGFLLYKLIPELDIKTKQFKKYISEEKNLSIKQRNKALEIGADIWKYEIDHKYGLLLPESEIMEDDNFLYFYQTNRKRLCAAWDKKNKIWQVNVDRSLLEGLSFSTPKRFEKIVFGEITEQENYYLKQYLIEYLFFGLDVGEIKTLTKDLDNGAKIEFSLEAKTWNEMLIGNSVGVEGGKCKYFEKNSQDERILHFGMLCKSWDVNIEVVFDEYENYEQYNFGIKEFGGYYN